MVIFISLNTSTYISGNNDHEGNNAQWDNATKVTFSFSGVDLEETCGGEKLEQCEGALLQEIAHFGGIPETQITNLELTSGTELLLRLKYNQSITKSFLFTISYYSKQHNSKKKGNDFPSFFQFG